MMLLHHYPLLVVVVGQDDRYLPLLPLGQVHQLGQFLLPLQGLLRV